MRYSVRQKKYMLTCNWNGAAKHFNIELMLNVSTLYKPHPLIMSMPINVSPTPDCEKTHFDYKCARPSCKGL